MNRKEMRIVMFSQLFILCSISINIGLLFGLIMHHNQHPFSIIILIIIILEIIYFIFEYFKHRWIFKEAWKMLDDSKEKNICLQCYIEKHQFVKNYKFPEFIETEKKVCYRCNKEKECRVDD